MKECVNGERDDATVVSVIVGMNVGNNEGDTFENMNLVGVAVGVVVGTGDG